MTRTEKENLVPVWERITIVWKKLPHIAVSA